MKKLQYIQPNISSITIQLDGYVMLNSSSTHPSTIPGDEIED